MSRPWSSQPFKAIYTVFFLVTTPPYLLCLAVVYLAKPLRRLPEWNVRQNLWSAMLQMCFHFLAVTRSQYTLYDRPETAGDRHVKVAPPPAHVFSGVLAASPAVKPASVDAVWFPARPAREPGRAKDGKVVIHFPGGAFVMAFGHKMTGRAVSEIMAQHLGASHTLWAHYRLSASPESRFPAAVQDALTYYHHVLQLGIAPRNVILSGDSAGGNIVLALLRYLEASNSRNLPLPGGALVFSPWVRVSAHSAECCRRSGPEFLDGPFLQWGVDSYVPEGGVAEEAAAYISPLHHPFKLSVPLAIHAGMTESFYQDIKTFAEEMALGDNRVQLHASPLSPHDLLLSHEPFQLTEELGKVVQSACEFIA